MGEMVADPHDLRDSMRSAGVRQAPTQGWREQLSLVWVVTRREMQDTMRDWRIVVPIVLLTLVFPVLLNFIAKLTVGFVRQYKASVIGEQTIPFLLLVVGFFPISFSLVIALETFVGEKERKSLEPLLATPLSNTQLYLGKMLAAIIPPVAASLLGITVYLGSLFITIHYRPPLVLVLQVALLTVAEALVMVSGAVIISSQTTSVRAANLLASFVILPMAILVQGEALILFWSRYEILWFVLGALIVADLILLRMGVRVFKREELLGGEIDSLNLRRSWRWFKGFLLNAPSRGASEVAGRRGLLRLYGRDVPELLRSNGLAVGAVLVSLAAALLIGWFFALRLPLPAGTFALEGLDADAFAEFEGTSFLPAFSTWGILTNNVRSLLFAGFLAVLSFGALAIVLLMIPIAIIGFMAAQAMIAGYSPLVFIGAFILPHGILELPAAIIATAMALRLGASVVSPAPDMTIGQSWLQALAHFVKMFVLVVLPLLVVAALIEVHVTPHVVAAIYGG